MKKPWNPAADREDAIAAIAILLEAGHVVSVPRGDTVGPNITAIPNERTAYAVYTYDYLRLTCSTPEYAAQRFVDFVGSWAVTPAMRRAISRIMDAAA